MFRGFAFSAGVGRTGTFITIDYLSQFIKEHDLEEEVNIFGFVLKMRDRRVIMVQAEASCFLVWFLLDVLIL